jgi:hypothetical protein
VVGGLFHSDIQTKGFKIAVEHADITSFVLGDGIPGVPEANAGIECMKESFVTDQCTYFSNSSISLSQKPS